MGALYTLKQTNRRDRLVKVTSLHLREDGKLFSSRPMVSNKIISKQVLSDPSNEDLQQSHVTSVAKLFG